MFFIFLRFLGHLDNHIGQKWSRSSRKSTKNGVGRHHFRTLLGSIGAPACALLGPNLPIWSHHMVHCGYWWKMLPEMLKSAVFSKKVKIGSKNLYSRLSLLFISGVNFYGFYIFSYNFQPIWIILFAFSSQSDRLTSVWSEFWIFVSKQNGGRPILKNIFKNWCFWYAYFQVVPFWSETKIKNSDQTKVSPSDCEENAKGIIQIGWKL